METKAAVVEDTAAEVYERHFVPALFGPWGPRMVEIASIEPAQSVLDVACGTGALTRSVAAQVGPDGATTGLDPSDAMLAVARRCVPGADFVQGRAEALPFDDGQFDRVVSQFGFMFFQDPVAALREMGRVLRSGGRMAVAVCDGLDHSPGYAVLTELLHRLFGPEVAASFRAPFALGDRARLRDLAARAGLAEAEVNRHEGQVYFDSVAALVAAERACVFTLGGLLDADQFARLRAEAQESLAPFVGRQGAVVFGMPALVLTARA